MQTLGHCHLFTLLADEIPSAIHSLLACYSWLNDITTLVDFADDGALIEITIYVCDQSQQLFVNSYFNKRRL